MGKITYASTNSNRCLAGDVEAVELAVAFPSAGLSVSRSPQDDEFVSAGEAEYWERRLGVTIPKPP